MNRIGRRTGTFIKAHVHTQLKVDYYASLCGHLYIFYYDTGVYMYTTI